jgi:hypothetical protein
MNVEKVRGCGVTIRERAKMNFIENNTIGKRKTPEMSGKGK